MMTVVELIATALALSVVISMAAGAGALVMDRLTDDVRLRAWTWAGAFYASAVPPIALLVLLAMPPTPLPHIEWQAAIADWSHASPVGAATAPESFGLDGRIASLAIVSLAGLCTTLRLILLTTRLSGLRDLLVRSRTPSEAETRTTSDIALDYGQPCPRLRIAQPCAPAFVTGWNRPLLVLPAVLVGEPTSSLARRLIGHELGHIARGDNKRVWLEEAVLLLLAGNPLMRLLRANLAAVREEACDLWALESAPDALRHSYAESLLQALKTPVRAAGALSFTGGNRRLVMRRLKLILTPPSRRPAAAYVCMAASGVVVALLGGLGTSVLAAQRASVSPVLQGSAARFAAVDPAGPEEAVRLAATARPAGATASVVSQSPRRALRAQAGPTGSPPAGWRPGDPPYVVGVIPAPAPRPTPPSRGAAPSQGRVGDPPYVVRAMPLAPAPHRNQPGRGAASPEPRPANPPHLLRRQGAPSPARLSGSATLSLVIEGPRAKLYGGEVLRVWMSGPAGSGDDQPRLLEYPLQGGVFEGVRGTVTVPAEASYAYRAELVDHRGRPRLATWAIDTIDVGSSALTERIALMPANAEEHFAL